MEAVKVETYQQIAHYRAYSFSNHANTLKLPTPSTIRGLVHRLLDAKEYHPLKISIQGEYTSVFNDLENFMKFDTYRDESSLERGYFYIPFGDEKDRSAVKSTRYVQLLYGVRLILHVCMEDVTLHPLIRDKFLQEYVSIGRWEDSAKILSSDIVNVEEVEDMNITLTKSMYVPRKFAIDNFLVGTSYYLPFTYDRLDNGMLSYNYLHAVFLNKDFVIGDTDIMLDSNNDPVFFLS